jgi:hypothetical protein
MYMAVRAPLERFAVTRVHTWRLIAMAAQNSKGRVFSQRCNAVILRMKKIIAAHSALRARFAFLKVNIQSFQMVIPIRLSCVERSASGANAQRKTHNAQQLYFLIPDVPHILQLLIRKNRAVFTRVKPPQPAMAAFSQPA